jgi:hypothetical protein
MKGIRTQVEDMLAKKEKEIEFERKLNDEIFFSSFFIFISFL